MSDISKLSDDEVLEIYLSSKDENIISLAQIELFKRNKPLYQLSNVSDDDLDNYDVYEHHVDIITD